MRSFVLAVLVVASGGELVAVESVMQQAFYPALLTILILASLGLPIPEDLPLIVAGLLLRTHGPGTGEPGIASWHGTLLVALVGVMTGDLVLYMLGRRWGPGVVNHKSVRWMITPDRFARVAAKFRRHGAWFCFGGRFFMGVRAVMCLTAGATHFPCWRFFLADLAGAAISVPFFVGLGYVFAGMIPTLRAYVGGAQAAALLGLCIVTLVLVVLYRRRRRHRHGGHPAPAGTCPAGGPAPQPVPPPIERPRDRGPVRKPIAASCASQGTAQG